MNFDLDLKALAYPASNLSDDEPVSPCLCSLVFRCDDAKLATLLLVVRIPTAHGTTDSEFVLQYDGDNLMPTGVKLVTGKGHLKRPQLDELAPLKGKGKKRVDVKTLQLSTKQVSPVWCPASTPTFCPKPGHEPALQRLVELAKETKIDIVFDFNQLHQHYQSSFKAFGKAARGLAGYPVEASLIERGLRKANWGCLRQSKLLGRRLLTKAHAHGSAQERVSRQKRTFSSSTDSRRKLQLTSSAAQVLDSPDAGSRIVHDREDRISQSRD